MQIVKRFSVLSLYTFGFVGLALSTVVAQPPLTIEFSQDTVGAEPTSFVSVVGIWRIENEGGKNLLAVDGRQWKEGESVRRDRRQGARAIW